MNIAGIRDGLPAGARITPPRPPLATDAMTAFDRISAMRKNMIESWGPRAYTEDIIKGSFLGRNSFIVNAPDAIRHVLIENYENYTRTPAGIRVLV